MLETINKQSIFCDDYIASNFQNTWFVLLLTIKQQQKTSNKVKERERERETFRLKNKFQGY